MQEAIDIHAGLSDEAARKMAANLQFEGPRLEEAAKQIKALYGLFLKVDATQVEINPLGETPQGQGTVEGSSNATTPTFEYVNELLMY